MRSIERRFRIEEDKDELASTIIIFSRTVSGQRFSKRVISSWFMKLVDKDDYERSDKRAIIEHLVKLSNS